MKNNNINTSKNTRKSFSFKKLLIGIVLFFSVFSALNAQKVVPVVQAGHSGSILYVEWDPSSRYLASIDTNNELVINDLLSGKMFPVLLTM